MERDAKKMKLIDHIFSINMLNIQIIKLRSYKLDDKERKKKKTLYTYSNSYAAAITSFDPGKDLLNELTVAII